MKKITKTVYTILWPGNTEPTFAFIEMPQHGCVTIDSQSVDLLLCDMPEDSDKRFAEEKLKVLREQQKIIEREIKGLTNE